MKKLVRGTKLPYRRAVERDRFILDRCRGRKVLHVGCTDAPFTREKWAAGHLFHTHLAEVSEQIAGVDIDAPSIRWLSDQGVTNLHQADASHLDAVIPRIGFSPDVVVAGEVVEHLSQPVDFLSALLRSSASTAELIVSVPNAFHLEVFLRVLLFRQEKIHPEHTAHYSYCTLHELMARAGLRIDEIVPCRLVRPNLRAKIAGLLQSPFLLLSPYVAPGYVVVASKASEGSS